jgi:uncharacterized protein
MLPEHAQPLAQADLARLDRFRHTAACGEAAMGLSYAHGFLTAVASGPEQLEPAEWLRLMFDDPVFERGEDAREMLGLALRLFREIEHGLGGGMAFRPVFEYVRDTSGTHADAQRWCRGFAAGYALFSECWTREARAILDTPLSLIFELARTRGLADPVYMKLCDALPDAAGSVYRYWRAPERV